MEMVAASGTLMSTPHSLQAKGRPSAPRTKLRLENTDVFRLIAQLRLREFNRAFECHVASM